jgi:prephenate dehydrogenase
VSHLPHLLAAALTRYLGEQPEAWKAIAGSGLRDTTRIAAGDPLLWSQIFEHNRAEVLRAVDGFEATLQAFKSALQAEDHKALIDHLKGGKQFRDSLRT